MESPTSSLPCAAAALDGDAEMENSAAAEVVDGGGVLSQVDPFLVEALGNPRHRLTILRMELDVQRFMKNSDLYQFEFQHFPTSYLRCAVHRVTQHYGLQTMVADNFLDGLGSRIIVRKTPESRYPAVLLSDIPTKQPENEKMEHIKIAVRPRQSKGPSSGASDPGSKSSNVRTVEERKEEYDRARARIFSGSSSPDAEDESSTAAEYGRSSCSNEECLRNVIEELEKISTKDGASRVAIFRDREKDRTDPDYDRSYDRYAKCLVPCQNFSFGQCNVLQPSFLQYEAAQFGQVLRTQAPLIYGPPNTAMSPLCAIGCNQTSRDAVYIQWPSPGMVYGNSYEHFGHAIFQAPFYQQPLSFEHSQNRHKI